MHHFVALYFLNASFCFFASFCSFTFILGFILLQSICNIMFTNVLQKTPQFGAFKSASFCCAVFYFCHILKHIYMQRRLSSSFASFRCLVCSYRFISLLIIACIFHSVNHLLQYFLFFATFCCIAQFKALARSFFATNCLFLKPFRFVLLLNVKHHCFYCTL